MGFFHHAGVEGKVGNTKEGGERMEDARLPVASSAVAGRIRRGKGDDYGELRTAKEKIDDEMN